MIWSLNHIGGSAMRLRALFLFLAVFVSAQAVPGQENPLWLRYPAISPDGNLVLQSLTLAVIEAGQCRAR
jgi:hypothetical protein